MIKHDVIQNTPEWHQVRCGKATASEFDSIVTPKDCDLSKQAEDYANRLAAEIYTGDPVMEFGGNDWTERGHELEPEAIAAYQLIREEAEVEHGGFVSNDDETYGASPERFVKLKNGEEGLLEIKCFMAKNQVKFLLGAQVERKHWPQLQGQLLVTGREWVDIMFYHPKLPPKIVRVERDEEYIKKLKMALDTFVINVKDKVAKIKAIAGD